MNDSQINSQKFQKQLKPGYINSRSHQLKRLKKHLVSKITVANQSDDHALVRHYLKLCTQIEKQLACRKVIGK